MKSNLPLEPIFRVEYRDREGETIANSVFFRYKEDAIEYAEAFEHIGCSPYICKYYLK